MLKQIFSVFVILIFTTNAFATYTPGRPLSGATDSVSVTNLPATQAVSATALPLPTGAATGAKQDTGNASLSAIDTKLGNNLNVNVVSSSLGGATAVKQDTSNASLSAIDSKLGGTIAVNGSGVTQPVSASALPLPTGAATSANQATEVSALQAIQTSTATIATNIPTKGAQTVANAQAVTLATDQSPIQVSQPDLIIAGAATTVLANNALLSVAGATALDVSGYRSGSVQIVSPGTVGAYIFENSNDGVNFQPMPVYNSALVNGAPIIAAVTVTNTQLLYTFPIRARYIRLRVSTAITSGITAFSRVSQESWSPAVMNIAQATAGNLQVTAAVSGTVTTNNAAGTNAMGDVGIQYRANATGAALRTHLVTAATTNSTIVKASAGRLLGYIAFNNSASWRYVKLYNVATAPVVGTTAVVQTVGIPPGQYIDFNCEGGIAFTTGIGASVTAAPADADATAVTGGDVIIDLLYQ